MTGTNRTRGAIEMGSSIAHANNVPTKILRKRILQWNEQHTAFIWQYAERKGEPRLGFER